MIDLLKCQDTVEMIYLIMYVNVASKLFVLNIQIIHIYALKVSDISDMFTLERK